MATRLKKPTIKDVARLAGVAPAIASRALSHQKRPISKEKKERVLLAAKELNYTSNPLAKGLATNSIDLVSIIINQLTDLSDLDLFDPLIAGLQQIGRQATIIRVGDADGINDFLTKNLSHHASSAIVFSDFADSTAVQELFLTKNVLMLNGLSNDFSASVWINDRLGIESAINHAKSKGVDTAVMVCGRGTSQIEVARSNRYFECFEELNIKLDYIYRGDYTYKSGKDVAQSMSEKSPPQAVFCTSDAMAMGIKDGLIAYGLRAPEDYLLFGYDVVRQAHFDHYDISSIGFRKTELIEMILQFVKDPDKFFNDGPQHQIDSRFVRRGTS